MFAVGWLAQLLQLPKALLRVMVQQRPFDAHAGDRARSAWSGLRGHDLSVPPRAE